MTGSRTFIYINTCCTNIIKLCHSYLRINTSSYTNTPPTGADKSGGPDFDQHLSSWKGSSPCSQLGADNSRPIGIADNNRLPSRANTSASAGKTSPLNTLFCRGTGQVHPGVN